jgi:hypothetical protein
VTVTVAVVEPLLFVAVNTYVVVVVGLTDFVVWPVTLPTALSMESCVASVTSKDKILGWPLVIDAGLAVKLLITGGAGVVPVTVTEPFEDVPAPNSIPAASVYVV